MVKKRDKGISNPQILLTAIILLVIIALLLSVYYKTNVEEKNNNISSEQLEEGTAIGQSTIDCETVCEGNGECLIDCKDSVLIERAKLEDDVSLCEKINYNVRREECVNFYYFDKAVLENNIAFCDKINVDLLKENCKKEVNK